MNNVAEEQVDVIDESGKFIRTVPKSLAHKEGLLHRIVIGQLKNSKGEYCFVRQSKGRQDASQFVSPIGGHVSSGESLEGALIRESQEEVGIGPVKYRYLDKTIYNRQVIGRQENHLFFIYVIETDQTPVLNHESDEFRYFTTDEIKAALESNDPLFGAAWHHVFRHCFADINR